MKIQQIQVTNYRLLKDFTIDLEQVLSLAIGKNNCGKTSFLSVLEKFFAYNDYNRFAFDDFNIELQHDIQQHLEYGADEPYNKLMGLALRIVIEYNDTDNLANISTVMLDLDPEQRTVILQFEYAISDEKQAELKADFLAYQQDILTELRASLASQSLSDEQKELQISETKSKKNILFYLKKFHGRYFALAIKAIEAGNETNVLDITKERQVLDKIISFKRIKARRDVANEDGKKTDRTLSRMSSRYYEKIGGPDMQSDGIKKLQLELSVTDEKLNDIYDTLFSGIIEKVRLFGGVRENESNLMIVSGLEERNILSNNTTVMYHHNAHSRLPEDYNGLGYLNLISMIFEIEVLLNEFKKHTLRNEQPADINLLFIEEPEAHTHPQMQYVFIKNVKNLLQEASSGTGDGVAINLQTIITTHSSCIVAESDFDDLKYFQRLDDNEVIAKNLKDLQRQYTEEDRKNYQFLRQYLTLNRSELFFADKAILIEGDTERLLLPAMMRKLDKQNEANGIPLLSQHISIVEVGAHSHIFEKFIDFLGIKTLIITDLDAIDETRSKCRVSLGKGSSNQSIQFFINPAGFDDLLTKQATERQLSKQVVPGSTQRTWKPCNQGHVLVAWQFEEMSYTARSFEDAFIHLNRNFINQYKQQFTSLQRIQDFDVATNDAYDLAEKCIDKKSKFALDILFFSDPDFTNWEIPQYIKEGLLWLKQ
jgi:predicted ATP-dependent endonuclease of OLD family